MARLTSEQKESIRKEKGTISVREACEKHGISKATYHRVVGDKDMVSVTIPTVDDHSFASVLDGKVEGSKDKVDVIEQNDRIKKLKPHKDVYREDAVHKLMENILDDAPLVEDKTERVAVTQKIIMNVENFAPMFKFIDNKESFVKSLHTKSLADLKGILETMTLTRTTVNLATQMKSVFFVGSRLCEIGGSRVGLKLDGLTSALQQERDELNLVFREIAIDYAPMFNITTRPEIRLGMLFVQTALAIDNSNRIKDAQPKEEKFKDL